MICFSSLKKKSFKDSNDYTISVVDSNQKEIAKLLPIGTWVFKRADIIQKMYQWRKKYMKMFFTWFAVSIESTRLYLEKILADMKKILFLIIDLKGNILGNIGLIKLRNCVEFDNVIKDSEVNISDLMVNVIKSLLLWCKSRLHISKVHLHVLSYNSRAIRLYSKLGFKNSEEFSLLKVQRHGETIHKVVEGANSNVEYRYVKMICNI